jgi:Family of unknown function (DUF6492)
MSLAVVTPSYKHDAELFGDLHRSVLRLTDDTVMHYVVVPAADAELFKGIVGKRGVVIAEESLYPSHYKAIRGVNSVVRFLPFVPAHARIAAVNIKNLRRPVRGWLMQQLLKLEVCRKLDVDTVLLVDSDVELVRPISEATFRDGGRARLYRHRNAVDDSMPTHMEWTKNSRDLLGLPQGQFPASEYVSSLCVWEPNVVRALLARVEQVTGLQWMDAITAQRTFSEWTLYGVFAEEVMKYPESDLTESSMCLSYWGHASGDNPPLTQEGAMEFVSHLKVDDVAVLIQSKTRTPRTIRRVAIEAIGGESHVNDDNARRI